MRARSKSSLFLYYGQTIKVAEVFTSSFVISKVCLSIYPSRTYILYSIVWQTSEPQIHRQVIQTQFVDAQKM